MRPISATSTVILIALATPWAVADEARPHHDASIDQLKAAYLWCDRTVTAGRLDAAGIMQCSVVYEALKHRAFHGDFERLHEWTRAHVPGRNTGVEPPRNLVN